MSNYTNTFSGAAKDAANDIILGADFDTQYDALATMSATKSNKIAAASVNNMLSMDATGDLKDTGVQLAAIALLASPTFTGTVNAAAITASGTITGNLFSGPLTGDVTGDLTGNADTVTDNANLTGHITSTGNAAILGAFSSLQLKTALSDETGSGAAVFATSPSLVTPSLGTPSALVGTNISGTAASLTAGNVTTNANLTGEVTSIGNAALLAVACITGQDDIGAAIVDTDEFLISDGGVLKRTDASRLETYISATSVAATNTWAAAQTFSEIIASAKGISFPATAVPSADVNTLDDYEEGTWTPVLWDDSLADEAVTYTTQTGTYTKIGRCVHFSFSIVITDKTALSATDNLRIGGLPFQPGADYYGLTMHYATGLSNMKNEPIMGTSSSSGLYYDLWKWSATTGVGAVLVNMISDATELKGHGTYFI